MKKYRFIPGLILLVLSLVAMSNENIPAPISMVLLLATAAVFIYSSRGTVYFSKAVKAINSGDYEKKLYGVRMMKKALDAGLSNENAVVAASVMLQNDEEERAREILEPLTKSSEKKVAGPAMSSLSMYYWLVKDYDKAIELCEKAMASGYVSRNICINLLTYYLAAGKTREFSNLLEQMGTSGASSPAVVDFLAINEMFKSNWKQAGAYLEALCVEANPGFPDAYIHFAQVCMHYGEIGKAIEMLKEALDSDFAKYSVYTKDYVNEMIRILSDGYECVPFAEAASRDNKAILKIANGQFPKYEKAETEFTGSVIPGAPQMPDFREIVSEQSQEDDRDANTELSEADEKWLRKHQD